MKNPTNKIAWNCSKNHLNTIFCVFINSSKKFHEHMRTENANYKIVWKCSKSHLNTIFFVFINFSKIFCEYIRTENQIYKVVWNYSKNHSSYFKYNIFCFHKFFKKFSCIIWTKHLSYKIVWDYSKIIWIQYFFVFIIFSINFCGYIRTENLSCPGWLKNHLNCFKYNFYFKFFCFKYKYKNFCQYIKMETQFISMKTLREKYLNNMLNNLFDQPIIVI